MDPDSLPPVTRSLVQSNNLQNGDSHLLLRVSAPQISSSDSQRKGSNSQQYSQFSSGFNASQQSQRNSQKKEYPPFKWEFRLQPIESGNPILQTLFQSLILGLIGIVDTLCAQRHELYEIIHRKDINLLDLSEAYGNSTYKPKRYKAEFKKFQKTDWETRWYTSRISGCDSLANVFDRAMDSAQPVWGFHAIGRHWAGALTIVKNEPPQSAESGQKKTLLMPGKTAVQQASTSSNEDDPFDSFGSPFRSFTKASREGSKNDTQNSNSVKGEIRTLKRKRKVKEGNEEEEDASETDWSGSDDASKEEKKRIKTELPPYKPSQTVDESGDDILLPSSSPSRLFPRFSQSQPSDPIDLDNLYNPYSSDKDQLESQPYSIPQLNEHYNDESFIDTSTVDIQATTEFHSRNTDNSSSSGSSGPSTPRRSKKTSQPFKVENISHSSMMLHQRLSESPSPKKPKQDRYMDLDIKTLSSTKIELPPPKTSSSIQVTNQSSVNMKSTKIPEKSVSNSVHYSTSSSSSLAKDSFPALIVKTEPQISLNASKADLVHLRNTVVSHQTANTSKSSNNPAITTISTLSSSVKVSSNNSQKKDDHHPPPNLTTTVSVSSSNGDANPTTTKETSSNEKVSDVSVTSIVDSSSQVVSSMSSETLTEAEQKRQKLKEDLKKKKKRKVVPKSRF